MRDAAMVEFKGTGSYFHRVIKSTAVLPRVKDIHVLEQVSGTPLEVDAPPVPFLRLGGVPVAIAVPAIAVIGQRSEHDSFLGSSLGQYLAINHIDAGVFQLHPYARFDGQN